MKNSENNLTKEQLDDFLTLFKNRFEENMIRHKDLDWEKIQLKLESNPTKFSSLCEMEITGWEPDVVGFDKSSSEYIFIDCSPESPSLRRSLCYDNEALESRKEFKPKDSAIEMAKSMWVELLNEEQYRDLQKLGDFDLKTSSWLKTPDNVRKLGWAIFADKRYDNVFVYHNWAQSYYASRWFRTYLKV